MSALLRGIHSKQDGDYYCFNCFYPLTTEKALKKQEHVCKDHDYCYIEMPDKDNNILKYNPGEKIQRVPFIIYANLESLLENVSICQNDLNKSSTIKINKHTPSGYSLFTHSSIDAIKNS